MPQFEFHRIEGVDGHGLLTIEDANKSLHDAWYTATAVNKAGRDLTRCKVNVDRTETQPGPDKKLYIPKTAKKRLPVDTSPEKVDLRKVRLGPGLFSNSSSLHRKAPQTREFN